MAIANYNGVHFCDSIKSGTGSFAVPWVIKNKNKNSLHSK